MFKTEISSFTVQLNESSEAFTVPKVLMPSSESENGIAVSASFSVPAGEAAKPYAYLELPDLGAPAEILFNGKAEFSVSGGRAHRLDVSGLTHNGENTLEIRSASDKARLVFSEKTVFVAFSRAHIADITARTMLLSDTVSVEVAVEFVGNPTDVKAVATLVSPSGKIYYGGVTNGRALISVSDPLFWWPGTYGVHNLYKLNVNLYYESEIIDSAEAKIGLRSVFLDERIGSAFTVNGSKVFAMGAEIGENPLSDSACVAESLVPQVARANMNFIRYRCEYGYPREQFLSLCDTLGIAVEAVIKSKKLEDGDESAFKRELTHQLKRFSRHPSVLSLSYDDSGAVVDYERVLSEVKAAVSSVILVRRYTRDDVHELTYALADVKTLYSLLGSDDDNVFSYPMSLHTEGISSTVEMLSMAAEQYKYAKNTEELAYMSGILQAHTAEGFVNDVRMRRDRQGSAVISALVSSDYVISRSAFDASLRQRTVISLARRFFAPVSAFVRQNESGVSFYLSNETKSTFDGVLEYSLRDGGNKVIYASSVAVSADGFSSCSVHEESFDGYLECGGRETYLSYSLLKDGSPIFSSSYLFAPPKHYSFREPSVLATVTGSGREYTLTYSAPNFAKDVVFSFVGTDAEFEENCVDITSPLPSTVRFSVEEDTYAEKLNSELVIKSVYSIGAK